jgi:hypothetical protein
MFSLVGWAQTSAPRLQILTEPTVNEPLKYDVSAPLRDLPVTPLAHFHSVRPVLKPKMERLQQQKGSAEPLPEVGFPVALAPISATINLNFDGIGQFNHNPIDCGKIDFGVAPPDANLAVGDTQVVQWVNECFAVFDKATGKLIVGPLPGTQFWQDFGRGCQTNNDGDPIIQWDKLAHRWVAFQNVFTYPYETCVAISQTADATGSYYRYAYLQSAGFPDYPKVGIMPDAYYQSQNIFSAGIFQFFLGVAPCAYDRVKMLAGLPAKQICFFDNGYGTLFDDSMLPADLDSADHPPAKGQPEVFLGSIDNTLTGGKAVYEYLFHADFQYPNKSWFSGADGIMPIKVPPFDLAICTDSQNNLTSACVPQPPVLDSNGINQSDTLDTLGDRLMYRLAYFNDGTHQYWTVTHSVNDTSATAVRWYQFTAPQGTNLLSLSQSGQTPNDKQYRWMGSVAMDKSGDIALGYSKSSLLHYPSIYYAGQTVGDPPNSTESEAPIKHGYGSQLQTQSRWGDYSSMALDSADGCTLWYTTEYYRKSGSFSWNTRIASLKFPNCH